jgi:hypothetical protein
MRRISCRLLGIFALCAIASFSAGVSRADGVTYTLTGSTNPEFGPVHAESFSFTTSSFVTAYTDLLPSQLTSCVACQEVEFYPNGTMNSDIATDEIRFTDTNGVIYGFFFDAGAFDAPGTYTASDIPPFAVSNIGTLTVTTTAVAEPSAAMLLTLGLIAMFGVSAVISRRSQRAQVGAAQA